MRPRAPRAGTNNSAWGHYRHRVNNPGTWAAQGEFRPNPGIRLPASHMTPTVGQIVHANPGIPMTTEPGGFTWGRAPNPPIPMGYDHTRARMGLGIEANPGKPRCPKGQMWDSVKGKCIPNIFAMAPGMGGMGGMSGGRVPLGIQRNPTRARADVPMGYDHTRARVGLGIAANPSRSRADVPMNTSTAGGGWGQHVVMNPSRSRADVPMNTSTAGGGWGQHVQANPDIPMRTSTASGAWGQRVAANPGWWPPKWLRRRKKGGLAACPPGQEMVLGRCIPAGNPAQQTAIAHQAATTQGGGGKCSPKCKTGQICRKDENGNYNCETLFTPGPQDPLGMHGARPLGVRRGGSRWAGFKMSRLGAGRAMNPDACCEACALGEKCTGCGDHSDNPGGCGCGH